MSLSVGFGSANSSSETSLLKQSGMIPVGSSSVNRRMVLVRQVQLNIRLLHLLVFQSNFQAQLVLVCEMN
jgi:hypothetical protein